MVAKSIITQNSLLQCDKGSTTAPLQVSSQLLSKVNGLLVATEMDKQPMVNIPCFGTCMQGSPPPPCIPSLVAWKDTAELTSINGLKCLTESSSIVCAKGGKISIAKPSQALSKEQ